MILLLLTILEVVPAPSNLLEKAVLHSIPFMKYQSRHVKMANKMFVRMKQSNRTTPNSKTLVETKKQLIRINHDIKHREI